MSHSMGLENKVILKGDSWIKKKKGVSVLTNHRITLQSNHIYIENIYMAHESKEL